MVRPPAIRSTTSRFQPVQAHPTSLYRGDTPNLERRVRTCRPSQTCQVIEGIARAREQPIAIHTAFEDVALSFEPWMAEKPFGPVFDATGRVLRLALPFLLLAGCAYGVPTFARLPARVSN